jgi:hypothetical protein
VRAWLGIFVVRRNSGHMPTRLPRQPTHPHRLCLPARLRSDRLATSMTTRLQWVFDREAVNGHWDLNGGGPLNPRIRGRQV